MGRRGPLPKDKSLKVLSGKAPITKENLAHLTDFTPPACPRDFTPTERKFWKETVAQLEPLRVLEQIDLGVLAAYCGSYVRWREAEKQLKKARSLVAVGAGGGLMIHPLVTLCQRERKDMVAYATQLGMTPAARMRVQVVPEKPAANPFDKLKGDKKK